jgi:hypothetical protein
VPPQAHRWLFCRTLPDLASTLAVVQRANPNIFSTR